MSPAASAGPFLARPVTQDDAVAGFASGEAALDAFLARHAVSNAARGIGTTFVLPGADPQPRVLGFYTLSMALVDTSRVAPHLGRGLPRYPLPVALIGRLAVDQRVQGQKVGQRLLGDALRRVEQAALHVGCVGVVVDAKHAAAQAFYERFGFILIETEDAPWPRRLFLPMATIRAALGARAATPPTAR